MINYVKRLLFILQASRITLLCIIILFLFTSLLEVLGIGIVGPFIAIASNPALVHQNQKLEWLYAAIGIPTETQFVAFLGLIVILVFVIKSCVSWFTQSYITRFSDKQQRILVTRMVQKYMSAPYYYHISKNSSSIVSTVLEVSNVFSSTVLHACLTTLVNVIIAISLFVLLFATNSVIMLVLLVVLLPVLLFFNSFKSKVQKWGKQCYQSKQDMIGIINHAFGSVKEVKVIGCEDYFNNQVVERASQLEVAHGNFVTFKILPRYTLETVMVASVLGVICVSLLANQNLQDITAVLGIYALASIRMLPAISNSVNGINQIRNSSYTVSLIFSELVELDQFASQEKIDRFTLAGTTKLDFSGLGKSSSLDGVDDKKIIFSHNSAIAIESISYAYPNAAQKAVSNISLTLNKGDSIAFIGKSGAGKTTLVDIILGLLVPQSGDIKVDGISIYEDLNAWINSVGYIPQSIFLMDDTLEKNIAFGVPESLIDQQRLQESIRAAQLEEVIEHLPAGLSTRVGERGIILSGGQRQRVGIARALYHEREILVLDEATAALDNETELLVTEAIKCLGSSKTIITIAHRLSTVQHCDRIYLLNRGEISKSGNYEEVVLGEDRA